MPWFPDFVSAVELARRQTRAAGQADPVAQYLTALSQGDTHVLETVWPGEVVIYDPRAGEVRGHKRVRRFISDNLSWLAALHARTETVASTVVGGPGRGGTAGPPGPRRADSWPWPVAVVAESPDDRSVVFRTYCSQWPLDERRHVRPPILKPRDIHPGDVVGRYQAALAAGDTEAVVSTFAPDGYFRGLLRPAARPPRYRRAPLVLRRVLQRGRRHRPRALRGDRRRRALRPGVQLRPLGQPRPAAPGGTRRLRARPGRAARRGPRLRRRGSTRRAALRRRGNPRPPRGFPERSGEILWTLAISGARVGIRGTGDSQQPGTWTNVADYGEEPTSWI